MGHTALSLAVSSDSHIIALYMHSWSKTLFSDVLLLGWLTFYVILLD